jgi:putative FmdB family regulatory protein
MRYDYHCYDCDRTQEEYHSIKEDPEILCEVCGKPIKRIIYGGAGIKFVGNGFYQTDYKNKEKK